MATYSAPGGAAIRGYTRLNGAIYGITDAALETALAANVADGEDATFARIGDSYETATGLTARVVRNLQRAVSCRTAVWYLREMLIDKTSGTQEPILMEDAESIRAAIEDYEAAATEYEALVLGVGQAVNTSPFAMPSVGASSYTRTSDYRSPSDRIDAIDERDDISSTDGDA